MVAHTVTLLNKLPKKDSITGLDVWYKTILHDIPYKKESVTNVTGTVTSMGEVFTILIPFSSLYLPYHEWKNGKMDTHYTINQGDYLFLNVDIAQDVTPSNVVTLKNQHEPFVCEVKTFTEVEEKNGVKFQLRVGGI